MSWNPSDVYRAWDEINHGLVAVMKQLPAETLQFLAFRASDPIIRQKAAEVLDWLNNRDVLPDWGWFAAHDEEPLRRRTDARRGAAAGSGSRKEESSDCDLGSWSSRIGDRSSRCIEQPFAAAV